MKDDWLEYVPPTVFHSRNEVYEWLAQQVDSEMGIKKEQIVQALLKREETGDIQIDEGVLLPHIENQLVKATKVIILPLEQRIANWNPAIQQVELILAVFLAPQEKIETKRQIANFMRLLADEQVIKTLKEGKRLETIDGNERRNDK
ncbi:PTS sugar transporter subunit IIA [Enterococcus hirae]|uniref:PTS sugar transporter subunit IIA n=1 Tax=Enterococcus hirae TaxID=1354 RepID=UPI00255AD3BE|nr:PTS sugar transporter subunit IIA [Enterococcus hirae]MDL4887009.1 PTS sugar transporter subunit IIA [Enterococcus hirae]MDL4890049.1 PTS sugar transporter subunit IIA [Enterococcus hirae]MDL4895752.1 PTS sugar transporter subunit IIA [Enterococcus hirae]MDL4898775.1 PTS sugar transporter subunit IIA [Enterococcus hirae]MDL4901769.1 PTS sugar transporter subunit IIA [Enterococcus hirae]